NHIKITLPLVNYPKIINKFTICIDIIFSSIISPLLINQGEAFGYKYSFFFHHIPLIDKPG
ncbi:MAG TPA: hypothetical protein DEG17_00200, partial [Cyanobacteria bacterium UBA11149]|nr:hypothetical protein [Cyanobacteria bacterium UBA11166]HBW87342.1 hypothetical protein [Cyanobacteria bacterium UBA11149]